MTDYQKFYISDSDPTNYVGAWTLHGTYAPGDVVSFSATSRYYEARNNMLDSTSSPPNDPINWKEIAIYNQQASSVHIDDVDMNFVVVDGTLRFGKLPLPSIYSIDYGDSSDELEFNIDNSPDWNSEATVRLYYAINDSTPDTDYINVTADGTGGLTGYIMNYLATYGTGSSNTLYLRWYYDGIYSSVTSESLLASEWVYIGETDSAYDADLSVTDFNIENSSQAQSYLESIYDATDYGFGTSATVIGDYGIYYLFEAQ